MEMHPIDLELVDVLAPPPTSEATPWPELPGWVVESRLGDGAQARVYRVHRAGDRHRRPYVAKVPRLWTTDDEPCDPADQRWRLAREAAALRALGRVRCPNVPRLVAHGGWHEDGVPWLVMPYYAGGAMCRRDESWTPCWAEPYAGDVDRVLGIAETLAHTLACLHACRPTIVHRDLHAGNVLLASPGGPPVLADFGLAQVEGFRPRPGDGPGSGPWCWRPPELDWEDFTHPALPASDVFMLGGLIYEALTGGELLPSVRDWESATVHGTPELSLRRRVDDPRMGRISRLLDRMLCLDPAARLSAEAVAARCRAIRLAAPARAASSA